ncbi:MAG: deoxyribonuclease V [Candidatus Hadarchaeia archaeon]
MLDILKTDQVNLDDLRRIQRNVRNRVIKEDRLGNLENIAGCDVSFSEDDRAVASCVLFSYPEMEEIDAQSVKAKVDFPYIPTFLAFRELVPLLKVVKKIDADVYMVDAQGIAHPRRAGLASHMGVTIDRPTIGVAKSKLCGEADEPDEEKGSYTKLRDEGEVIGAVLRSRSNVNPIYVSIGHKVDLDRAVEITLNSSPKYKIPEPIRAAHRLATEKMKDDL